MKSIFTRRLLLLALLAPLFTLTALADDPVEVDGIMYNLVPKGKIATVTKNMYQDEWGNTRSRYSGSIVIPSSITITDSGTTYSVVGIGDSAFGGSDVTSVTIPNSVTSIGNFAFSECSSLTSVTIPNSVTSIGEGAFQICSSLTSVTIPNSVTSIENDAFGYCSSLISVTIPESVTSIGNSAFCECSSLISVTIPNSVTGIGSNAFRVCSSLTSVILPESVTYINNYAFSDCSRLTSVTIPESVIYIGEGAFYGCSSLTSVTIPESVTSIPYECFCNCYSLTSVTIPESVTKISSYAFYGCSSLTAVVLPNLGRIDEGAFFDCISLRSVTIVEEGPFLEDAGLYKKAFANCMNLEEFSIEFHYFSWDWDESGPFQTTTENTIWTSSDAFEGSFVEYATLHVPEAAIGLYKADATWSQFGTITSLGSASTYYKLFVDVNAKGQVVYGEGENAKTITGASQTFDVKEQEDIVLTLTAYEGYKLGAVTVNGVDKTAAVTSDGVLTITDVNGNQTVSVEFVLDGNSVAVTIGELGAATFCCEEALDFSDTEDVKAYIVSAFHPATGKVTLTRITDVPAGTGIVLLGNEGTYDIPLGTGETYVVNMLVGVTADKVLNKTEGANSNFILANGENGVGFYAVKNGSTLAAGKAYLSLPTAVLPSSAQSIGFRFDDATNIASPQPSPEGKGDWYDLSGRRVNGAPTAPGLYIKDGRKVIVK